MQSTKSASVLRSLRSPSAEIYLPPELHDEFDFYQIPIPQVYVRQEWRGRPHFPPQTLDHLSLAFAERPFIPVRLSNLARASQVIFNFLRNNNQNFEEAKEVDRWNAMG